MASLFNPHYEFLVSAPEWFALIDPLRDKTSV